MKLLKLTRYKTQQHKNAYLINKPVRIINSKYNGKKGIICAINGDCFRIQLENGAHIELTLKKGEELIIDQL